MSEEEPTTLAPSNSIAASGIIAPKRLKIEDRLIDLNNQDLINIMKCPTCFVIPFDEIYSCLHAHRSCSKCLFRSRWCPTCHEQVGRNNGLEEIIKVANFHCEYLRCSTQIQGKDMKAHLKICDFRPVRCYHSEIQNCEGTEIEITKFQDHLLHSHSMDTEEASEDGVITVEVNPNQGFELQNGEQLQLALFNFETSSGIVHFNKDSFIINICIKNDILFSWITFLGVESKAKKYKYSALLRVSNPSINLTLNERTLEITNILVHSHQNEFKEIHDFGDSFWIGVNALKRLCHANEVEQCKFYMIYTIRRMED